MRLGPAAKLCLYCLLLLAAAQLVAGAEGGGSSWTSRLMSSMRALYSSVVNTLTGGGFGGGGGGNSLEHVARAREADQGPESLALSVPEEVLDEPEQEVEISHAPYRANIFVDNLSCLGCRAAINTLITIARNRPAHSTVHSALTLLCSTLRIQSGKVCAAAMEQYIPEFYYILNTGKVDATQFCSIVLQGFPCNSPDPRLDWKVDLPPPPPRTPGSRIVRRLMGPPKSIKFAHVTDIHFDPDYQEGTSVHCGEPLCCRPESRYLPEHRHGLNLSAEDGAGYWGEYRGCDMPWRTIQSALDHIAEEHKDMEYMIMTGDLPPHALWTSSQQENTDIMRRLNEALTKRFPNITIYPTIGNHEAHPLNSFGPLDTTNLTGVYGNMTPSWLFEAAADAWSQWLPPDALETVRRGGFYSVQVQPGFRIIAINSNLCYVLNWWQIFEYKDPYGMLAWLVDELTKAERAGEKVHIIGHLPPGSVECWGVWSRQLDRIINRFRDTVTAQFYGHTHFEEFKLVFAPKSRRRRVGRPVSPVFIGGSVSSYIDLNPNYKTFTVDGGYKGASWHVVDHDTWIFNLTEANQAGSEVQPRWFRLYSAREDLELAAVSPVDMHHLVLRMVDDEPLFDKFYGYYVKRADTALAKGCDLSCKEEILCNLVTSDYGDLSHCSEVKKRLLARR